MNSIPLQNIQFSSFFFSLPYLTRSLYPHHHHIIIFPFPIPIFLLDPGSLQPAPILIGLIAIWLASNNSFTFTRKAFPPLTS
jgi:hypothetical protein